VDCKTGNQLPPAQQASPARGVKRSCTAAAGAKHDTINEGGEDGGGDDDDDDNGGNTDSGSMGRKAQYASWAATLAQVTTAGQLAILSAPNGGGAHRTAMHLFDQVSKKAHKFRQDGSKFNDQDRHKANVKQSQEERKSRTFKRVRVSPATAVHKDVKVSEAARQASARGGRDGKSRDYCKHWKLSASGCYRAEECPYIHSQEHVNKCLDRIKRRSDGSSRSNSNKQQPAAGGRSGGRRGGRGGTRGGGRGSDRGGRGAGFGRSGRGGGGGRGGWESAAGPCLCAATAATAALAHPLDRSLHPQHLCLQAHTLRGVGGAYASSRRPG